MKAQRTRPFDATLLDTRGDDRESLLLKNGSFMTIYSIHFLTPLHEESSSDGDEFVRLVSSRLPKSNEDTIRLGIEINRLNSSSR
jgi:hypothetical protein